MFYWYHIGGDSTGIVGMEAFARAGKYCDLVYAMIREARLEDGPAAWAGSF